MKGKRAALVRQVFSPCIKWAKNGMLMKISLLVPGLLLPGKVPPTGTYLQIPYIDMSHSDLLKALSLVITCPSKGLEQLQETIPVSVIFLSSGCQCDKLGFYWLTSW